MEEEKNIKSLKDLLLTIVEIWEKNDSAEVRRLGEEIREEVETAEQNNNISQQYFAPHLSSTSHDLQTEEIFQQIL